MNTNPEQLFLLEILIDTIVFGEGSVPQKKQVIINCNFESIVNFEIRAEGSGAIEKEERDSKRRDMEFNIGKSYLFSCDPRKLIKALDNYPLEIAVSTRLNPTPIGISLVDWGADFNDMVQASSDSYGYVTPAAIYGLYNLRDANGLPAGSMDLFIRLSCFGKNIQTSFQVIHQAGKEGLPDKRQFLFKYTNAGTTFVCERYGMGTSQEMLPVAPLYNSTDIEPVSQFKTLFSNAQSRQSVMPFLDFDFLNRDQPIDFSSFLQEIKDTQSDTMSIIYRPDDVKLINLFGLLKEMNEKAEGSATSIDDLTADEINKRLCRNPNCPAAKKFKEFGLGPLATGKGLGCIMLEAKAPTSYGLSHANGTMDNYGPYGIYTRPKNPDQPFIPKKKPSRSASWDSAKNGSGGKRGSKSSAGSSGMKSTSNVQRLRGGGSERVISECALKQCDRFPNYENVDNVLRLRGGVIIGEECPIADEAIIYNKLQDFPLYYQFEPRNVLVEPLRLRGGWSTIDGVQLVSYSKVSSTESSENFHNSNTKSSQNITPLRLSGGGLYDDLPSPMSAVKDLLQDFDKVVDAYRRALGPCGQATCPFSRNVVEETCRKICRENQTGKTPTDALVECENCSVEENESISACGASSCPYGRLNTRSETEDELKSMQPKPACGDFTCKFVKRGLDIYDEDQVDLDVLPRNCGAPTCKFSPQPQLPPIHWDCPEALPKGPCKNPNCPHLSAQVRCYEPKCVCDVPACAYAMPPSCGNPSCPFHPPRPCPYANQNTPSCPPMPQCPPPSCPPMPQCPPPSCPRGPECPYGKPPPTICPFEDQPSQSTCGNVDCPYAKVVEACPFLPKSSCGSPACPYAQDLEKCPYAPDISCPMPPCKQPPCYPPPCFPPPCPPPSCFPPPCPIPPSCYPPCYPPRPVCSDPVCPFREVLCLDPCCPLTGPVCDPDTCPLMQEEPDPESDSNECTCPPCLALQEEFCEECFKERMEQTMMLMASGVSKLPGEELTPCCSATCQVKGGTLECTPCIKLEDAPPTAKGKKNGKKGTAFSSNTDVVPIAKKRKGKYVYNIGDDYPGMKIGHRRCVEKSYRVPYNMGWMWHIYSSPCMGLKPRYGWKPGAIGFTIANIIKKHREKQGLKMQFPPEPKKKRRRRKDGRSVYGSESDDSIPPKPTLQIKKKEGTYYITMNPLKDPYSIADNENPYVDCTPMQFKITKNKKPKAIEGEGDEYKTCFCNDEDEKVECEESSSDSELDIEFTPPAGIIRPERLRKKKTVVHTDTQYNPNDFKAKGGKGGKEKKGKGGKGKKGKGGKGKGKKKK